MNLRASLRAIAGVARKEFLHIWRDKRIVALIVVLPPFFTFLFGHAFEVNALKGAAAILHDRDQSPASTRFFQQLAGLDTFAWRIDPADPVDDDLARHDARAILTIPAGWGEGLHNGTPLPLHLVVDGSDTRTAVAVEGALKQTLGKFQLTVRDEMFEELPAGVTRLGEMLPVEVRRQFASAMHPWTVDSRILYNPQLKFIDYVMPGVIGLILQLLTVTLTACTITREREAGTLYQLMVTSLRQWEIVIGKVLPFLAISMLLIALTVAVGHFHFGVHFQQPLVLGLICLLFLLCSLGMGLLISSFCETQTQAIQFAVFYLLPVFPLSGAFAPLHQLPENIRFVSNLFPLTHFCHAFRLINLNGAPLTAITTDLALLALGVVLTCGGAALLLKRTQQ
jgi:ABC-2 type transport system permease protein